jgi:hypothetical protein
MKMRLRGLPALGLLLGSWVCVAAASAEDAALDRFFRQHLEAEFRLRPTLATELGDHRFDDQLDEVSAAARARWPEATKAALEELPRRVEFSRSVPAGQVDYRILEHHLRYSLWMHEHFDPYVTDPRSYSGCSAARCSGCSRNRRCHTRPTSPTASPASGRCRRSSRPPGRTCATRRSSSSRPRSSRTAVRSISLRTTFALAGRTKQRAALEAAAGELLPELRAYQQFLENELRPRANGEWRIGRENCSTKSSNGKPTPASRRNKIMPTPWPSSTVSATRCM